ncbi:GNAT family protein [Agromyces mediolanus]|uniref:GNAT family N-acetyltransferase n=1 Tax=Agromyces mediolanus TaxID=41986 RepID=UPI00383550DB
MDLVDVWPVFRLRLRSPRLELRPVRDDDLPGLAEAALDGVHPPGRTPFGVPWTDAPREELLPNLARFVWRERAAVAPNEWNLLLAVVEDGRPIGVQDLRATNFAELRTVSSGSWLTRARQGLGFGAEMRAALLLFAFDHLGATVAESEAYDWNAASRAVSTKLGYRENGVARRSPRPGVVEDEVRFRLEAAEFRRPEWALEVSGIDEARPFLLSSVPA